MLRESCVPLASAALWKAEKWLREQPSPDYVALQKVFGDFWRHMAYRTAMTQIKATGLTLYRGLWCGGLATRYQQERRAYATTIESELSEAVHNRRPRIMNG